ncbi:MAG: hypothetical protein NT076_01270 [Candidatus Pacearchaeota archaeon]|nr:hypothetical protein [Candidatus Pacearchaeota archaeon]
MSDYYSPKEDKVDFKQIVLGHYKKILEISTAEFTGGYFNYVSTGNSTNKTYVSDKRAEYIQAIESLALALFPHFDEQMKKDYQKYLRADKELQSKYADKDGFIKHNEDENNKLRYHIKLISVMKELFKDLSCLMYRLDYFKTASYSEGDLEEAKEIVDVDGKEIIKTPEEQADD